MLAEVFQGGPVKVVQAVGDPGRLRRRRFSSTQIASEFLAALSGVSGVDVELALWETDQTHLEGAHLVSIGCPFSNGLTEELLIHRRGRGRRGAFEMERGLLVHVLGDPRVHLRSQSGAGTVTFSTERCALSRIALREVYGRGGRDPRRERNFESVERDFGLLSLGPSPKDARFRAVAVAGIRGWGTMGAAHVALHGLGLLSGLPLPRRWAPDRPAGRPHPPK